MLFCWQMMADEGYDHRELPALIAKTHEGNLKSVELLLDSGAHVDIENVSAESPSALVLRRISAHLR